MKKAIDWLKGFVSKTSGQITIVAIVLTILLIMLGDLRGFVVKIAIALLMFSIIVIVHEFGHFLLAKKNGIGVTDFSLGMGPKIWSFEKGETTYSLRWFPLGGSCMMVGEDQDIDQENAFNKKSVWARMSVIAAGPIFNFILAFIFALFVVGFSGWDTADITVMDDMPAKEAGLQDGDIITKVNGVSILNARDLATQLQMFDPIEGEEPVDIEVRRDGKKVSYEVTPKLVTEYVITDVELEQDTDLVIIKNLKEDSPLHKAGMQDGDRIVGINGTVTDTYEQFQDYLIDNELEEVIELEYVRDNDTKQAIEVTLTEKVESYMMGFYYSQFRDTKLNALEIVKYSFVEVQYWIKTTIKSLGYMIQGNASRKDIAGPVGMVNLIGDTYEEAYDAGGASSATLTMMYLCILLSANIGVMNLLPIPALDGGRLFFLIIEAIRRKPIKPELEGTIHAIGLILLMILMVFVFFNDIVNIITG